MDEEEDDFYDPADSVPASHTNDNAQNTAQAQPQESDDMDEEEYEIEEDDVRLPLLFSIYHGLTNTRMTSTLSQKLRPVRLPRCKSWLIPRIGAV